VDERDAAAVLAQHETAARADADVVRHVEHVDAGRLENEPRASPDRIEMNSGPKNFALFR
jgi:hypothetical protein